MVHFQKLDFRLGGTNKNPEEFLTQPLKDIEFEPTPIFSSDDILNFDNETHKFYLKADAAQRLSKLEIPIYGRTFVVTNNEKPILLGAFWNPFSSVSFRGIVIIISKSDGRAALELKEGYPSKDFFTSASSEQSENFELLLKILKKNAKNPEK